MDLYASYFEITPVDTAEKLMSALRLRYEVYCVENAFEDPAENPGFETDAYDAGSLHSLLLRRDTSEVIGTVRLILPLSHCGKEGTGLPIRDVCRHELVERNNAILPWQTTAEISRFAISKSLRRRTTEGTTIGGFAEFNGARHRIPESSLGLMQAIVAMAACADVTHLCAVMEPCLLRMLARLGIHFTELGPLVEYHGLRQPCYADLDQLLARAWAERYEVWQVLTRNGELWPVNRGLAEVFMPQRAAAPARRRAVA